MSKGKVSPAMNITRCTHSIGSMPRMGWCVVAVAQTTAMSGILSHVTLRNPPPMPGISA